jgi:predicted N-acetyltransferase YhbS
MSPHHYHIRPVRPEEAEALSRIAYRAAASWGYPEAWLEQWRPYLTLDAEYLRTYPTFVAEEEEQLLGFCTLTPENGVWTLAHHWVDPPSIGRGLGSALFDAALDAARSGGAGTVRITSDPQAAGFYERHGARRVGEMEAEPAGRIIPVYEITL